jgi:hypothetical protein
MLRKDDYIRMLEKRASDFDGGKTGPTFNHDIDNQAVGNEEHQKNLTDNRATLGTMFTNMGEAQKVETRFSHKWFPSEKYEKDTSSPLIKVAMDTLSQSSAFRGYPAHYKAAAVRSFTEELEKISGFLGGALGRAGIMAGGLTAAAAGGGQLGNIAHQFHAMPGQFAQAAKAQGVGGSLARGFANSAHSIPQAANPFMYAAK